MCNGHRKCSPSCPPRRVDGTPIVSLASLCLLCWNTGCRIPVNGKHSIGEWIDLHPGTPVPPRVVEVVERKT